MKINLKHRLFLGCLFVSVGLCFAFTNMSLIPSSTLTQAYLDGLGRAPAPSEALVWMASGNPSYDEIIRAIKVSLSSQPTTQLMTIINAYQVGFGRGPIPSEIQVWQKEMSSGNADYLTVVTAIKQALKNQNSIQLAMINQAYQNGFGRAPLASEIQVWQGSLNTGQTDYQDIVNAINRSGGSGQVAQVYFASQQGAVLNSNIDSGGGTDNTAALQAILDLASNKNPIELYIDGVSLISAPLRLKSNTTIQCGPNAGLFLANNAEGSMLTTSRFGANYQQTNISIIGCTFNGNFAGQTLAPTVKGQTRTPRDESLTFYDSSNVGHYYWKTGVWLISVDGLSLQDVTIRNATTYGLVLSNVANATINNLLVWQDTGGLPESIAIPNYNGNGHAHNWDGIHLWGSINNLSINGYGYNGDDDWIAFSGSELAGIDADPRVGSGPSDGAINNVTISNVTLTNSGTGGRFIASPFALASNRTISNVTLNNINGTVSGHSMLCDHVIVNNLTISNWNITSTDLDGNSRPLNAIYLQGAESVTGLQINNNIASAKIYPWSTSYASQAAVVTQAYQDGLGRLPTPQEMQVWTAPGSVNAQTIRSAIKSSLVKQAPAQLQVISTAYQAGFHRPAINAEIQVWQSAMNSGKTDFQTIINSMKQSLISEENLQVTLINQAYLSGFGRVPTPSEIGVWQSSMAQGASVYSDVIGAIKKALIAKSPAQTAVIHSVYQAKFGRMASDSEITFWSNAMSSGLLDYEDILSSL